MLDRVLCEASEKAKIIVNRCLDGSYDINPVKLDKLLIIMHGMMLSRYHQPFFSQQIISLKHGLTIQEVERDFRKCAFGFKQRMTEYIAW